jgi:hypothetical protein
VFSEIPQSHAQDPFHGVNSVMKTCNEGLPEQKQMLGTDLFFALRELVEDDVNRVAAHIKTIKKHRHLDFDRCKLIAKQKYRRRGLIRSKERETSEQLTRWQAVVSKWRRIHSETPRGQRCVIRPELSTRLKGTIEQAERQEDCIRKGCYAAAFPSWQQA